VITCDTYPRNVSGIENRLISRFDGGLTVRIEPPEFEMRKAILRKKAEVEGFVLDDELTSYIAEQFRLNVYELERSLKRIMARASFHQRKIDLALVREALRN
jgi:chromosomal replication initiator protein